MGRESTLPPGSTIKDTYQVVRKVASGGMGEVYLVRHLHLDISFALKLMLPQWAREPMQVSRFHEEARLMARIQHPNVARVVDCGEYNSYPYLIMEWLEGETLYDRAERVGRLPLTEVVDICWGIATALLIIHDQGIVHRDIKPGNVFLCPELGGGYRVKVLDFGIARIPRRHDVTLPGTVLGTPEYMAPEQARGDSQAIGPRTDQYALAMVAYRLLGGAPAFTCPENMPALFYRIEVMEPPPLPPEVPASVQAVIRRGISKNPLERYESVQAFAEALDLAATAPLAAEPVEEHREHSQTIPPSTLPHAVVRPGRLRLLTSGIAGVITMLLFMLIWKLAVPAPVIPRVPRLEDALMVPHDMAQPLLHWQVNSTPAGAEVYDVVTDERLGTTPWSTDVTAGALPRKVELRLAHYQLASTELSPAQNELKTIVLSPIPRSWQVVSEPAGARVVDRVTGAELGRTPWKFSPEHEDHAVRHLRVEGAHMVPVDLDLDPQRDEDKKVTLRPIPVTTVPLLKLSVLCVDSTNLEARSAAVFALRQAGIVSLRTSDSILIKREGSSLVIAHSSVAALDEVKQRIIESALREILRGHPLPEQLLVKCSR